MKTLLKLHPSSGVQGAANEMAAQGEIKNPYTTVAALEATCNGNDFLEECLAAMLTDCLRYAETVCRFQQIVLRGQASNEDGTREEIEAVRGRIHDTTIASINALSRAIKSSGRDNQWISKVSVSARAGYATFALLLAFEVALNRKD